MHPKLVEKVIEACRARDKEGDCPVTEIPGSETLQWCIIDLADKVERTRHETLTVLAQALKKVSPDGIAKIVSDVEAYNTKLAERDAAFDALLAALLRPASTRTAQEE